MDIFKPSKQSEVTFCFLVGRPSRLGLSSERNMQAEEGEGEGAGAAPLPFSETGAAGSKKGKATAAAGAQQQAGAAGGMVGMAGVAADAAASGGAAAAGAEPTRAGGDKRGAITAVDAIRIYLAKSDKNPRTSLRCVPWALCGCSSLSVALFVLTCTAFCNL